MHKYNYVRVTVTVANKPGSFQENIQSIAYIIHTHIHF